MKKEIYILQVIAIVLVLTACDPEKMSTGTIGVGPTNPKLTVTSEDPHNPVFTASADHGYIFHWDMGNGQKIAPGSNTVTSYYPFAGTYTVDVTIYGDAAQSVSIDTAYVVSSTDLSVSERPVWKELTGGGAGRTWVYNTDPSTGLPDYCYQTTGDLVNYPDNWMPSASWGQCVRLTPDINGEMTFDLDGGVNYTYHQVAGDAGVKGTFILDVDNMTITIKDPYILDHNVDCTNSSVTSSGVYRIMKLTDDEMVLWQMQNEPTAAPGSGVGWGWSFKRK
ncbi:PKD domain-containing protein [Proteiniphilum sp. X52]|uniref:PKD domain-containing protein n=1 Tax=Proteiniphilum sp. X52 TaxID=2382159 RepID=UPI000F09F809|nr:PKD domain-containing protein [Proteiniphilum sp. X52]RNC63940.1 hypothetical protein D7D25_13985 [Proteiniphilum sp. X52]